MPKFKYAKLVRDKIVDDQIASGAKPSFRKLNTHEHKEGLISRIIEEAKEATKASPDELISEIADIQQAVDDLKLLCGIKDEDIVKVQEIKNGKKGTFKEGLFIDYVEADEDNKWIDYYRKNPDRFPEIE
jgi:predicted house-cleaning noncanonical NTP pyrophosphatase (MazG superfamily)